LSNLSGFLPILARIEIFRAGTAIADLTGNGSGISGSAPGDPFLFGNSSATVYLSVTDSNGDQYTFSTDFAETFTAII
jgi:hypothetical protein